MVYTVLQKMLDQWNAHDIDGLLEAYWKSPALLVVIDSEEINGWRQLHDSYLKGDPDRTAMRFIEIGRVQVARIVPYGTDLFGVVLSQALRARLRSLRPSGTFQTSFSREE